MQEAQERVNESGGTISLTETAAEILAGRSPGAQHGAIVLPRTGGTRVNVGEAGRAEAIVPLPDLAALAGNLMAGVGGGMGLGGGSMAGGSGRWRP